MEIGWILYAKTFEHIEQNPISLNVSYDNNCTLLFFLYFRHFIYERVTRSEAEELNRLIYFSRVLNFWKKPFALTLPFPTIFNLI